ncbi:hypothetical protein AMECASPLE_038011 [Ameca splendens]|uniref:Uncharacterized protein n=1 Tax=Ameca splendens TaxID=208324 RepID=A0ABV0XX56_9TELE
MRRNSATLRTPSLTSVRCRLCAPPASLPGRPCYSNRCGFGPPPPFLMILKELLEGPISPDGLFGPQFQSVLGQMQTSQEELEWVRRPGSLSVSGVRSSHTTGRWRDRRDQRHQQRRSTAAVAAPRVPPSIAPSTQPQQQRRGRQLACAWSNHPQEPRRRFKK